MRFAGLILAASLLAVPSTAQEPTPNSGANQRLTAQEVVDRVKAHVGIPWMAETVDTFKAGDPQTPVTGIAVTMMATLGVLKRAAANKQNLIITHEPTFYDHQDQFSEVRRAKKIRCWRKSARLSRRIIWWYGDFTITSTE